MQNWIVADEKYLDFLRQTEPRIPNSDYGKDHFKPFFGELFSVGDLAFITQVSSAKPRHQQMKNGMDFIKLFQPDTINSPENKKGKLIAVVNLNYMFPISRQLITYLDLKKIDQVRTFTNSTEKNKYIDLLKKELNIINTLNVEKKAKFLYTFVEKYPEHSVSSRCFNFRALEILAKNYPFH